MNNTQAKSNIKFKTKVISMISPREREVLGLIASGFNNKQIGEILFISKHTVKSHRKNLYRKLDAFNSASLVQRALEKGMIQLDINTDITEKISTREREVLQLIATGFNSLQISNKLFISHHTVVSHRKNLCRKLLVSNSASLMSKAHQAGIL